MFGHGPGGKLIDTPECLAYETPIDQLPYNAVMRFRVDEARADAAIDRTLAPYRERKVPVAWLVHPTSAPDDLRARLGRRGLACAEVLLGMACDLASLPPLESPAPGVEAFEGTADEASDWLRLVSWRYELSDASAEPLRALYHFAIGDEQPDRATRWWGARKDGVAVSKTVLHIGAGVAGIYGVATREEGRGLGLASLLTLQALHAARDRGCTLGVLHATPMAVGLYERLGFRAVADFEVWAEPGRLHL